MCVLQRLQSEASQRRPVLSALYELAAHLGKLGEESSLTDPEASVKLMSELLTDLEEKLKHRRVQLQVCVMYTLLTVISSSVCLVQSLA